MSIINFNNGCYVLSYAAIGSKTEANGPLAANFDKLFTNPTAGKPSWEQAESFFQQQALKTALLKGNLTPQQIDYIFAGDLINQNTISSFGLAEFDRPYIGLYGACSTMALSIINAAMYVNSMVADNAAAVVSSHFCTAERQYRFPLEYGGQRPPTAQWTATAAGAVVLSKQPQKIKICDALVGKIVDYHINDQNNMGAAMAPAAADTIFSYLTEMNKTPEDFDAIFTGDLGEIGTKLLHQLAADKKVDLSKVHHDCGLMLYDRKKQDVHAGGSGCGCSAAVLCSTILKQMEQGSLKNILFCATGALLSPLTVAQKLTIPSICHLVHITANG